jgi:hypothetical protein
VEKVTGDIVDVMGINLATGQKQIIFNNGRDMASADYSVDDTRLIFNRKGEDGSSEVWAVAMADSKIGALGDVVRFFPHAARPIWFVVGTPPSGDVGFLSSVSSGPESDIAVRIPVLLSKPSSAEATVDYSVLGGNAIGGGVDYAMETGRLSFAPGQVRKYINISVNNDADVEEPESLTIYLSRPVGAWMGDITTHTYVIEDDDYHTGVSEAGAWLRQP